MTYFQMKWGEDEPQYKYEAVDYEQELFDCDYEQWIDEEPEHENQLHFDFGDAS